MQREDYQIALISALPIERACNESILDERHPDLPQTIRDGNVYTYGRIGRHNVVLASLADGVVGTISAAIVATRVWINFPKLRFGLMVGIGGGAPDTEGEGRHDIRLGDVVVSKPTRSYGGVIQYDMGRTVPDPSGQSQFQQSGFLNRPPDILLAAILKLEARYVTAGSNIPHYLCEMMEKNDKMQTVCRYPGGDSDELFEAAYEHRGNGYTCENCAKDRLIPRQPRLSCEPVIHYGNVASGDQVMRHGTTRDNIAQKYEALCFEMEAAGLNGDFPCLIIRGICDYSDSHKNKTWQPYASAVAAAYAKELLSVTPVISEQEDEKQKKLRELQGFQDLVQCNQSISHSHRFFDVFLDTNKRYVEREEESKKLDEALGFLHEDRERGNERAALTGMGGCGKTELALRFAEKHRTDYEAVFWLDCATEIQFDNSLVRMRDLIIAEDEAKRQSALQVCRRWLCDNTSWLVIADSLDDPDVVKYFRSNFLQAGMRGSILVTSRLRSFNSFWDVVEVGELTAEQSRNLFQNIVQREDVFSIDQLARELGHLAIAIDQAGSYIQQQEISIEAYLGIFSTEQKRLLSKPSSRTDDNDRTIWTTWGISYELLRKNDYEASSLLLLLALLDTESLSVTLLLPKEHGQCTWSKNGEFLPVQSENKWIIDEIGDLLSNKVSLGEAMALLCNYSFLRRCRDNRSAFSMHPLIRYWSLNKIHENEKFSNQMKKCAIGVVASRFEKQDLFVPIATPTSHFTEGEERSLQLWPFRRYRHLVTHAIKCLHYSLGLSEISSGIATLILALLQVLEYPSAENMPSFDAKTSFALRILDHLDGICLNNILPRNEEETFLDGSISLWRLVWTFSCSCRKDPKTRCKECTSSYKRAYEFFSKDVGFLFSDSPINSGRMRALFCNFSTVLEIAASHFVQGHFHRIELSAPPPCSWIETYTSMVRQYHRKLIWVRSHQVLLANAHLVSKTFTQLLPMSEEARRSTWHLTSALAAVYSWEKVKDYLMPLVESSINQPCVEWSHERCIISLLHALLRLERRDEAIELMTRVRRAYASCGLVLKSIEKSELRKNKFPNQWQIFVKTLTGRTYTCFVSSDFSVNDLYRVLGEKDSGYEWISGNCRLIFGGKQLERNRFLVDYGIHNESTLHLVLRLLGGNHRDT